mgnify:CR=1 FL=1
MRLLTKAFSPTTLKSSEKNKAVKRRVAGGTMNRDSCRVREEHEENW